MRREQCLRLDKIMASGVRKGAGRGQGMKGGSRRNKNIKPCKGSGPGHSKGKGQGNGRNRQK